MQRPTKSLEDLRVAIVHYWFVTWTGGEKVVEALAHLFPRAHLFAVVAHPQVVAGNLRDRDIQTSFLQRVPGSIRWHRHFLPLYPLALEQWNLREYDLVISSESGPAKGVITGPNTCHVCYCHTPMRYLWDLYPEYCRAMGPIAKAGFTLAAHYLRLWDVSTAARVDHFVANSAHIAARIRKYYRRDSEVIHPPVETEGTYISKCLDDYYLVVSRLVDYKRLDIAIEACNRLGARLRIIGDGPEYKRLRRLAGSTVEFLGRVDRDSLSNNYAQCRALLFPGEEDFGIVVVEAQAFGRPVIAYGRGGVLETVLGGFVERNEEVRHPSTGILFADQSVDAMTHAIRFFERHEHAFCPTTIRGHALQWSTNVFKRQMREFLEQKLTAHHENPRSAMYAAEMPGRRF